MWFKRKEAQGPLEPVEQAPPTEQPTTSADQAPAAEAPEAKKNWWARTWDALNKPVFEEDEEWAIKTRERVAATRKVLVNQVQVLVLGRGRIDDDLLEELEEILLTADVGVDTTEDVLAHLRKLAREEALTPQQIPAALATYLEGRLGEPAPLSLQPGVLNILMIVGVNGVGKTTTIGKLASRLQLAGHPALVAAGDTFRAAAIDQIEIWGERAGVEVVRHQMGGDAAAVVYDAIRAAKARNKQVLLVDTAGRLHNKANLMEELHKIRRIIDREAPEAPVQVLLVLDATTGQNGLRQAEVFKEATGLTGVILTKLDGTAKGGVIFSIRHALGIPVQMVGLGEKVEDLGDFDPKGFVRALFGKEEEEAAPTP